MFPFSFYFCITPKQSEVDLSYLLNALQKQCCHSGVALHTDVWLGVGPKTRRQILVFRKEHILLYILVLHLDFNSVM